MVTGSLPSGQVVSIPASNFVPGADQRWRTASHCRVHRRFSFRGFPSAKLLPSWARGNPGGDVPGWHATCVDPPAGGRSPLNRLRPDRSCLL